MSPGQLDPLDCGQRAHLLDNSPERGPGLLDRSHIPNGEAGRRGHSHLGTNERKLVPQHPHYAVGELGVYVRLPACVQEVLCAFAERAIHLPNTMRAGPPVWATTPGSTILENMYATPP
jgi:hypothetical protein